MPAARPDHLDPDFSRDVLRELYAYRRKRRRVAWALWATLGWLGAHRFYLGHEFTGLAMLFTGGGALAWWLVDAALINGMVDQHNERQAFRERHGMPPLEMDFMPPLWKGALERTPTWLERWEARSRWREGLRFAGDVLVVLITGTLLGGFFGTDGAAEAIVAVLLVAGITAMGAGPRWLDDVPGVHALTRWSHRLRLFYHHNAPGSPPALLLRSVLGILAAPFRARDRAEVKLYIELGAAFTAGFLLLDLVPEVLIPLFSPDVPFQLGSVLGGWILEALTTFFLTYAFAAPIGAVLTLYLLVRPTHTVPRLLAGLTVVAIALGIAGG